MDDDVIYKKRMHFLWVAGNIYAKKIPQLSRYFVSKFTSLDRVRKKKLKSEETHKYCPYCHSILLPSNHSSTIKPKPPLGSRLRRLQKQAQKQALLSNKERRLLRQWENATNKLSILCEVCKKTIRIPCGKRHHHHVVLGATPSKFNKFQSPGTPMNYNSPQFFRHAAYTRANPFSPCSNSPKTPAPLTSSSSASRESTPSSSRKKFRTSKRDKHQQLHKMLASAKSGEKEAEVKSPLSAFLKSL